MQFQTRHFPRIMVLCSITLGLMITRTTDRAIRWNHYHMISPDLPGFALSGAPSPSRFPYTFDHLAHVMERFTDTLGLSRYAFTAPRWVSGWPSGTDHGDCVVEWNAYENGLSPVWNPIQKYWESPLS